ncbi:C69 family dipeptidase [Capnocytophaga sp. G2]|uniref:C69 family dipeptidase n=1 Tax=Capnocytophaga sp. G2 TaxID=3110695 RepID=UPI002B46CA2B|nr:C69 family dipeptidase [Capnocytophaga sp. G2]MEB3005430.1 C69 family dipeptidase [Capnocytophaga sp. G2]
MKKEEFQTPMEDSLYPSECTTIIVGKKMTQDGSMIIARSDDWNAVNAKKFKVHAPQKKGPEEFVSFNNPFRCKLPEEALGYMGMPPYQYPDQWESAGFNTAGVGLSATESIFSSDKALEVDPLVPSGLGEISITSIVLPYIHSAKEGVLLLGKLIKEHGVAEGFGVSFVDNKEIWYLETACGHRWLACRIPDDVYFISANQSRFRDYDPKDKENFLASEDLIDFAIQHKLHNPKEKFDFHKAYIRDVKLDITYNYPRVWALQAFFSPKLKNDVTKNTFPVYAKGEKPISLSDVRRAYYHHYQGTEHDPYFHENPKEVYRPVAIFRATNTHILQVRPELPEAIGEINYVALGMAALGIFIPLYQGVTSYPEAYSKGDNHCSSDSAYWILRKVQTLGMVNYKKYAPVIRDVYDRFEKEMEQRQREMEANYLAIYKAQPIAAQELLQKFSDKLLEDILQVSRDLLDDLFTRLTLDVQAEYRFAGA